MTITELYNQLENKDFQDHETGNLFFPAYMYTYDEEKEYEIDREILDIKNRLHRPNNYLDVMVIDLFEIFCDYLKQEKFAKSNKFDFYRSNELEKSDAVKKALEKDAYDPRFLEYVHKKIQTHLDNAGTFEVAYVFVKGFGNAYPYIGASRFMNNFEKYFPDLVGQNAVKKKLGFYLNAFHKTSQAPFLLMAGAKGLGKISFIQN